MEELTIGTRVNVHAYGMAESRAAIVLAQGGGAVFVVFVDSSSPSPTAVGWTLPLHGGWYSLYDLTPVDF